MLTSGAALGINTLRQFLSESDRRLLENSQTPGNPTQGVRAYENPRYNTTRGIISEKENITNTLIFQFNPEQITDVKENDWSPSSSNGFSGVDYIWARGGDRTITFQLWFDATAGSNNPYFRKNVAYGNPSHDTLELQRPIGTLDDVQLLTSFQYPIKPDNNLPRYSSGGVVPGTRFMPPPVLVFVFGEYYVECILTGAVVNHLLFNQKLIPVRSTVDVTLKVLEADIVRQDPRLRDYSLSPSSQPKLVTV